jgi:hypothetical protein
VIDSACRIDFRRSAGEKEKKEKNKTKIQENFLRSSRLIILIIPSKFAVGEAKGRRAFS